MKSSAIALIVVAVVIIGGFGVVFTKDPGLFSISTKNTLPSTSPGINGCFIVRGKQFDVWRME